jgi:hypothetical protein
VTLSRKAAVAPRRTTIDRFGCYTIAVLVPCYNEELAIAKVVADFRAELPHATIFVFDNNSSDGSAAAARAAGAAVFHEFHQGKGHVVRRMFADVEADIYVLVDGDATYHAPSIRNMIDRMLDEHLDMVVAARVHREATAYRPGHRTGNRLLSGFVARVFGSGITDMLSGYRVLSRRFVKAFPASSSGFEIETELTVHAIQLALPVVEIPSPYYARREGSVSKLSTWRDGLRIVRTVVKLYRTERPLPFFAGIGTALAAVSIVLAVPVVLTFLQTGLVPRLPTAVLSTGLMILAFMAMEAGLILDTVTRGRRELRWLAYLAQPLPRKSAGIEHRVGD